MLYILSFFTESYIYLINYMKIFNTYKDYSRIFPSSMPCGTSRRFHLKRNLCLLFARDPIILDTRSLKYPYVIILVLIIGHTHAYILRYND